MRCYLSGVSSTYAISGIASISRGGRREYFWMSGHGLPGRARIGISEIVLRHLNDRLHVFFRCCGGRYFDTSDRLTERHLRFQQRR